MKRKLIASLLCLCMLVSLLPVAAFATGDENTTTTPQIKVGISQTADEAATAIQTAAAAQNKPTVTVADGSKNIVWIVMTGLPTTAETEYTLSMKNSDSAEILGEYPIDYSQKGTTFKTNSAKYFIYFSLDEAAAGGTGKQINSTNLKAGNCTISVTATDVNLNAKVTLSNAKGVWTLTETTTPTVEINAVPANLTAVAGQEAPAYGHATAYTTTLDEATKTITVKATNLGKTTAGNPNATGGSEDAGTDYWVGVGLTKQESATYSWNFGTKPTSPTYKEVTRTQTTDDAEYVTMYWSPDTGKTWADTESKTGYISVKDSEGKTTDYTVKFEITTVTPVSAGISAGFSWTAAKANTDRNAAIIAAGKTLTVNDALDQTVWFMINEPVKGNHYWYEISAKGENTPLWAGAMDYAANATQVGMIAASFLHKGQNEDDAVVPAELVVNVWKTESAVTDKPAGEPTSTETITTGTNPLEIATVTPDAAAKTVKVTFNQDLLGRYYIALTNEAGDVVAKTTTECVAPTPAVAAATGYTFENVTLEAGTYTVSIFQSKAAAEGGVGETAIDSKDFTLNGNIDSIDVFVGDSDVPSTAITAKLNADKTAIEVSGSLANKENSMTIKLVAHTGTGDIVVSDIAITNETGVLQTTTDKKLTVLGTTYPITLALTAVETPVIEAGASADVSAIPEANKEAVRTALEDAGTKTTTDLTDAAIAAAAAVDAAKEDASYIANALKDLQKVASSATEQTMDIVVQPYINIEAKSYDAENGKMALEITGMTRVIATTNAAGINFETNAVEIGTAQPMPVSTSIDLEIVLPTGFITSETEAYILHKDAHMHKGTITAGTLAFTSDDGLSPFVIDLKADPVAQIDGTYYETLQKAVDAVEDGGTITLLKSGEATVNRTVKFKVAGTSSTIVATLKDASGKVVEADGDGFYSFTQSGGGNTSGGSGGGGGVSSNVTIDRPTNGKVSVSPTAPSKGATVTITLTPDTGYVVGSVTVTDKDGKAVELTKVSDTKYTFTMPDGKVKVAATFTKAGAEGFTDVPADAYYADAVKWAVEKGITNGLTATTFGPNNSCTRGQMVTFLWRAAGSPAATGTNSFSDVASGEYYYNAVLWAVEKGITNGTSATTFSPNATVNRGQTVTFLYRYAESPAATGESSFTDVAADAFYADAVKWAVAEEITNGTSSTTFSPASNCTRGQIVTFMYRQMAE